MSSNGFIIAPRRRRSRARSCAAFSSVAMVIPPPLIADVLTSALAAVGIVAHVELARLC
jgi:hypothetical protein